MPKQQTLTSDEYQAKYGRKGVLLPSKYKNPLIGRPSTKEAPVMDSVVTYGNGSCTITLVGLFPSLNKMLRQHWAIRKKHKQAMINRLSVLNIPTFESKVSIQLTFYHSILGDEDGLSGRFKSANDCLVDLGVFIDDSPEYVTIEKPIQVKSRRKDVRVEILIKSI